MSNGRLNVTIRALKVIKHLKSGPHTAEQLAERLDCNIRTAYRYIDAASIVFPVIEDVGPKLKIKGKTPKVYYITKED